MNVSKELIDDAVFYERVYRSAMIRLMEREAAEIARRIDEEIMCTSALYGKPPLEAMPEHELQAQQMLSDDYEVLRDGLKKQISEALSGIVISISINTVAEEVNAFLASLPDDEARKTLLDAIDYCVHCGHVLPCTCAYASELESDDE